MLRRTTVFQVLMNGQYEDGVIFFGFSVKLKVFYLTMTSQWSVYLPLFRIQRCW